MKFLLVILCGLIVVPFGFAAEKKKASKRPPAYQVEESASKISANAVTGMAGCGLGSMIVEKNEKWAQVGASLLNGTGMQSFAISFGTSNCTEDGVAETARAKDLYIEANFAEIRKDVANGSGEYLNALAGVYGCKGESANGFKAGVLKNSQELMTIPAEKATLKFDAIVKDEKISC